MVFVIDAGARQMNITQTSDSLIRIAVDYFERKNDKLHLMKAYYYSAVIYHNLGDSPHAQEYYLKALETGKSSADHAMLGRIYANLGSMYNYQNLIGSAIAYQKKELALQQQILENEIIHDKKNISLRKQLNRKFKKSSLWQSFVSEKNIPTEGEWIELDTKMEKIYPDMVHYLKQTKIDNENVRLCYLLKTGLPDKQIGVLLNLSYTALSKRKSRLHKKLTNEKESAKGLDLFLKEMFENLD